MSCIKILPEILSNKIAAGEVVERPSSVVKELTENAVDAGSRRIHIEVEKGGRSLLRISDDGAGMGHDDALLAIERYATSKIYTDDDLFSIATLGFRGEALPSIASVSRFSLVTRDETSPSGTEVIVQGGKIIRVNAVGAPLGTMVTVKDLFYNTPARRKFLKTDNTEMGHIADVVSRMALGSFAVRFKLTHNGKTVYNWTSSPDPKSRIADVLGKEVGVDLLPLAWDQNDISVSGWAASDRHARSTSRGIYLFVNNRFVRDKVVTHALFEGFAGRLMKGQYPLVVIFITLPPDRVDVNVHPTKHEVRFAEQKQVHDAVVRAVSGAFEQRTRLASPVPAIPQNRVRDPIGFRQASVFEKRQVKEPVADFSPERRSSARPHGVTKESAKQQNLWRKRFFGNLTLIGQLHNTYMVCQGEDGLILIDQHAAHERVLYERIKNRTDNNAVHCQKLLVPETFDMGYQAARILDDLIAELGEIGIEIEPFGGNTFALKAVPGLLADRDVTPMVMEIVDKMMDMGFTPGLTHAMDECHKIMACHGAIRANQSLSAKQMNELLGQLDHCENPDNCPHGRPTWIRWTVNDLEKKFRRVL